MVTLPADQFPGAEKQPLSYPGVRPEYSYVYYQGRVHKINAHGDSFDDLRLEDNGREVSIDAFLEARNNPGLQKRNAVLAVGSNGCPGRLLEKYKEHPEAAIPVFVGRLANTAVVYSRHVASYGAIPATYLHQPGALSWLSVNMLTEAQVNIMNETENVGSLYIHIPVPGNFQVDGGPEISGLTAYLDQNIITYQGAPILLELFARQGPNWPVMDQPEILSLVMDQAGILMGKAIEKRNQTLQEDPTLRSQLQNYINTEMNALEVNKAGALINT